MLQPYFKELWGLYQPLRSYFAELRGLHHHVRLNFWELEIAGLRWDGSFFTEYFMADTNPSPAPVAKAAAWNEDLIYSMLADPVRRQLLLTLAQNGGQPASGLMSGVGRRLDATLKQLTTLREAGLLVTTPDRVDKRRVLYSLAPSVPVVKTETGVTIDFGFCQLRFLVRWRPQIAPLRFPVFRHLRGLANVGAGTRFIVWRTRRHSAPPFASITAAPRRISQSGCSGAVITGGRCRWVG